ncbi:hypothetical protein CHH77_02255 [Shouchella clausii]|uniref:hypothetical protein n=1 Tax=Shouchella clausii TaxID=79880 RepID=UPI000BA7B0D9|nr:hypothetical protein [Shouchella clausii]PAE84960.1 hypothetical protein CHH77_02255 [Shouchella clausii]
MNVLEVFKFDREKVPEHKIIERVVYYYKLAQEGMRLYDEGDKSAAMDILKQIRVTMKEEYKYHSRVKVQSLMWNNKVLNSYYHFIQDAFVKQNSPNAYRTLKSNLYDVWDYAIYYYREDIKMYINESVNG